MKMHVKIFISTSMIAFMFSILTLFAQNVQIKELELDLIEMGYLQGEPKAEMTIELKNAVENYIKAQKVIGNNDDIFSDLALFAYEVDLESRIRAKKSVKLAVKALSAPVKIEVVSYQHSEPSTQMKSSHRIYVKGQLLLAGHLPFAECCFVQSYQHKDALIVVIEGKSTLPNCALVRLVMSVKGDEINLLGSPQACAPQAKFELAADGLHMDEITKGQLLPRRFLLNLNGGKVFEKLILSQSLNSLTQFEGKFPLDLGKNATRALYNPALLEALSTLLDPESLGWALKMNASQPIERRGDLIFLQGQFQQDETVVSIAVDLSKQAVHLCTIRGGLTRFTSTLLEGSFTDPDSSCPLNVEEAETIWSALEVLERANTTRIFSIEGLYHLSDDGSEKLIIRAREALLPDGKTCKIESITFKDKFYEVTTPCQTFKIRQVKDRKYDIDGEEAEKVE